MSTLKYNWPTSRDYLRHLIQIAFISISIPLVLFAWLYLEYSAEHLTPPVTGSYHTTVVIVFSVLIGAMLIYAHTSVRRAGDQARRSAILRTKLIVYRDALLKRYLLYGGATLMVGVGYYLTGDGLMVVWFALMILLYSIQNPSLHGIVRQLNLKGREKDIILKNKFLEPDGDG